MALKLGPCFLGFVLPIAVAVLGVFEFVGRLGQPRAWFGTALHGPRLVEGSVNNIVLFIDSGVAGKAAGPDAAWSPFASVQLWPDDEWWPVNMPPATGLELLWLWLLQGLRS